MMEEYHRLLEKILAEGALRENRTGVRAVQIRAEMLKFDLQKGFPILTERKLPVVNIIGELMGFIQAYTSAEQFRKVGCNFWDANANLNAQWLKNPNRTGEDDLGRIYGAQWRELATTDIYGNVIYIDQLANAVNDVINNPYSRRIMVVAWNPVEIDGMALPPCHYAFQMIADPETRELSMVVSMRSVDTFLGLPANIMSYALLLSLIAKATGYTPKELAMSLADVHLYENHLEQAKELLSRVPKERTAPVRLILAKSDLTGVEYLEAFDHRDVEFINYHPQPAIFAKMAV